MSRVSDVSGPVQTLTAELIVDRATATAVPVISPDGRWVAWTDSAPAGPGAKSSALWLIPVAGSGSVSAALVPRAEGKVRLPRWSRDSAALFYIDGEEVRRLPVTVDAEAETVLRWSGRISALAPLSDGRLAVVAGDEKTAEDERRAAGGDDAMVWSRRAERQHWSWRRLRLLDLASGELTVVAGLADRHVTAVAQRPDGGPLAVLSQDCPDYDPGAYTVRLHTVSLDDGAVADLGPVGHESGWLAWWRGTDGWHLAWTAVPSSADGMPSVVGAAVFDLLVPAACAAAGEPADLTSQMSSSPERLASDADGSLLALFAEGLDSAVYRLDPPSRSFRRVAVWTGHAVGLSVSADGSAVATLLSTARTPTDVHAGPPDGLVRLSDSHPQVRGIALGTQERVSWRAADGLDLEGILVLPPGRSRADGPFPLVTVIMGGPGYRWADQLMLGWVHWGQWLAAAGFAVFHPNPRGSRGRGLAFSAMVSRAVGQEEWTDTMSGIDALVADGTADPGRLGIGGCSHGGYISAWAVTQTSRFRAAVMVAGIADWGLLSATTEYGPQADTVLCGSVGWEGPGPHRHDQLSPVSYAAKVTTPVLILHGENDTNVPVSQARYFHAALSEFGVEHDLVTYPREGHNLTERAHQIDLQERVRAWFTRWLTPPDEGQP